MTDMNLLLALQESITAQADRFPADPSPLASQVMTCFMVLLRQRRIRAPAALQRRIGQRFRASAVGLVR